MRGVLVLFVLLWAACAGCDKAKPATGKPAPPKAEPPLQSPTATP